MKARFLLERAFSIPLNKTKGERRVMTLPACKHLSRGALSRVLVMILFSMLLALVLASPSVAQSVSGEAVAPSGPEASAATDGVSYSALADTLEDPAARDRLVEQLRVLAQAQAETQAADAAPVEPPASGIAVLSQRVGGALQDLTAQLGSDIDQTVHAFSRIGSSSGVTEGKLASWMPALRVLALVIAATLLAYAVLRAIAGQLFGRLNRWIERQPVHEAERARQADGGLSGDASPSVSPPPPHFPHHRRLRLTLSRKLLGVMLALVVDVGATLLAVLAGYVVTAALADHSRASGTFAFQFLTAFVLIEVVKALSRAVFATRYDHLRLLNLQPETATYWNRWISLLIALTGYCLLVVVPLGQAVLAPSVGRLIGLVIMLGVYITALRVVWSQKATVRTGLLRRAEATDVSLFGTLLRALARTWHWLAFAYLTVLLVASQAEQAAALAFMMSATAQSVLVIVAGLLLTAALLRLEWRHINLPEHWNRNFPFLERRVNSYKTPALRGIRLILVIVVSLLVLDAWRVFDMAGWLGSEQGSATVALVVRVSIVLATAALVWTVLASMIEHRVGASDVRRASEREKTLLMLFRNAAAIVIVTMTVLVVLSQIGIDIGPLIAGAGVVGLAIGFGAQKLVQDVITGVFIQLENGLNQNDTVEVAGRFGTVEKITVRSVVIRTLDGGYHLIPFSAIDTVSNHTRDFGYHYAEYNIAHREDVDQAMAQLRLAFDDLMQDSALAKEVLSDIDIPGVTALNERGFSVRVLIKTTPGNQWMIQRAFNRLVKQRFDAAGIEIPYPHTVLHFADAEKGSVPV
ncbi:mechanosensitive ion channel domain-containing protein [Achromobacter sp. F4_2707]|uniref:mechanosensitive ion channel domain-containing protein n=1 Tax=Achromobacter sp. F4_2707 TaxID=3114286 RepID=UPI0039C5F960